MLIDVLVLWAERRILVMQYVTGHRVDDLQYIDGNNISRDEAAAALSRIFNTMIFSPGAPLHCGKICSVTNRISASLI